MFLIPTVYRFWHREAFERSRLIPDDAAHSETAENRRDARSEQAHADVAQSVRQVRRDYTLERRPFL